MSVFKICYLDSCPKKPYGLETRLDEAGQKATRCGLLMGKFICEFADELRKCGVSDDTSLASAISSHLNIPKDSLGFLARIYKAYRAPSPVAYPTFEAYYIYRIDLRVLHAFIPILQRHYQNFRENLPTNVCLTSKSIEIELPTTDGRKAWFDLKELKLDVVQGLGARIESAPKKVVAPPTEVKEQFAVVATDSEVIMERPVHLDSTSTQFDLESGCMSDSFEFSAPNSVDELMESMIF